MTAFPNRAWLHLANALLAAALLSALQIYLRQWFADEDPALLRLVVLNLVAWAPWLPLSAAALVLLRGYPLIGGNQPRAVLVHGLSALAVSGLFLFYLSLFRLVTQGKAIDPGAVWTTFGLEAGEFFLVCLLLYAAIVAAGSLWLVSAGGPAQSAGRSGQSGQSGQSGRSGQSEPSANAGSSQEPRLEIKSQGRIRYVDAGQIDWISSEGSYVGLHVAGKPLLLRASMKEMAERLGESGFVRIHRCAIVNRRRVVARRSRPRGDAEVELEDGTILRMSRRYRAEFVDGP
jgi:hypothetical protein